jgi:hypothetical protein
MKKFLIISLILFLILITAFIKNSTKKIDDEIFAKQENLRSLNKEFGVSKLEFDYLSSTEKLFEFRDLYFKGELLQKDIQEIKIITKKKNQLNIKKLKFFENNE